MPTYQQYLRATQRLIEQNQRGPKRYFVIIVGKQFLATRDVFSPRHFNDTEIFAKHIPIVPGETFCEIGCGIGAVAIHAALKGASRVVATDINADAARIARANVSRHQLHNIVMVRRDDLFRALDPEETFDVGFWNTPFGFVRRPRLTTLELSVFDPGYKNTERFIKQGRKHFRRQLIGFSSTLGRLDLLQKFCREAGLKLEMVYQEQSQEILPVSFEIFEAKK